VGSLGPSLTRLLQLKRLSGIEWYWKMGVNDGGTRSGGIAATDIDGNPRPKFELSTSVSYYSSIMLSYRCGNLLGGVNVAADCHLQHVIRVFDIFMSSLSIALCTGVVSVFLAWKDTHGVCR
jgi:hypothetical protein